MNQENNEFRSGEKDTSLISRLLYQMIDEKYRTLLDESSDFMCITDRSGKFIYVNKKLADSLGYTKNELLGMHMNDIIAEESRRVFVEKAREFLKGGKTRVDSFVLRTKYKGKITGELNSLAFYDNAGKYCGAKVIFKDHTKILEIETLEKKYESMLEDGIGSLDQVILILDRDFKIRWASSSIQKYFCMDKTMVVGEDMRKFLKEQVLASLCNGDIFLQELLNAYETNRSLSGIECDVISDNKAVYCLEYWSYPIKHGDLDGGRIEIWRDITERKKSEEQLEYYYKKIHAIIEHAVEGIVELRTDNSIEFVNQSFLNMTGYSDMEMLNHSLFDFVAPYERERLVSIKLIRKAYEITFIKKSGAPLYTLMSSIPLVFGTQLPHALCFIVDITETKMATLKLKDANMQLRALNDSLLDLSLRDARTGVYNDRYLTERLSEEIKRAKRYFRPFSLMMIDIDFFKAVNDTYGHSFGDTILKEFTKLMRTTVRETDIIVRSGGEEFVVFLSDTDSVGAVVVANKLIKAVRTTPLGDEKKKILITISIGVASCSEVGISNPDSIVNAADSAMYQSKDKGRNRITVYRKSDSVTTSLAVSGDEKISFEHFRQKLKNMNQRHEESIVESLMSFVHLAEKRLKYPIGYSTRLATRVEKLASSFSMSRKDVKQAGRAALLCNLGYLTIPSEILRKKSSFTQEERRMIQEHSARSLEIIRDFSFLFPLSRDILYHHERYDGKGYPEGLKGNNLPPVANMISLAETYEALMNRRPYRLNVYSRREVLSEIANESGKQFSPAIVDRFLENSA